jgi:YgiT-type zinc finger domain-containing protein
VFLLYYTPWDYEGTTMKCHVCAGPLHPTETDLPFKVSDQTIVAITKLPLLQCECCIEYVMDDATFARVEQMLERADKTAGLETVPFVA